MSKTSTLKPDSEQVAVNKYFEKIVERVEPGCTLTSHFIVKPLLPKLKLLPKFIELSIPLKVAAGPYVILFSVPVIVPTVGLEFPNKS